MLLAVRGLLKTEVLDYERQYCFQPAIRKYPAGIPDGGFRKVLAQLGKH